MTREQYEMQKHEERRRAFMAAVEPIVRHKTYIASICMPTITVYADGRVDRDYPEWAKKTLAECDGVIAYIASTFDIQEDQ